MQKLVTPLQMQQMDAKLIHHFGIPGAVLMEQAAMAVTREVISRSTDSSRVLIVCGIGNNAGDGFAVLRQLAMYHMRAEAVFLAPSDAVLKGDAKLNYDIALSCGLKISHLTDSEAVGHFSLDVYDIIVDAIFGTGLCRPAQGMYEMMISRINEYSKNGSRRTVISVDIPSGIDALNGQIRGIAVRATATVTFQYKKFGHVLFPGREYAGEVTVSPIAPYSCLESWNLQTEELEHKDMTAFLPPRKTNTHKGDYGRALLLAGCENYTGAALLSANAALRAGCGLLQVGTLQAVKNAFCTLPEAMCTALDQSNIWSQSACERAIGLLSGAQVLAIGPGMGESPYLAALLEAALQTKLPCVIDADGLNALAKAPDLFNLLHEKVILTPHPGELSRLLKVEIAQIKEDPLHFAQFAADQFGCVVLLKGATSIICYHGKTTFNISGNPGLAKGGSGDTLTGIILALLAQKLRPYDAARVGAYLLGLSAQEAAKALSTRTLLAGDVSESLFKVMQQPPILL